MYDELVKVLRRCVLSEPCEGCPYYDPHGPTEKCATLNIAAADAIEELQGKYFMMKKVAEWLAEKIPRWIPVTERLPKEADGMVFVLMPDVFPYNSKQPFVNCNQDRRIEMAHYSEHSRTWHFGDCGAVGGQEPIAWIHRNALPQPMEGGEQDEKA